MRAGVRCCRRRFGRRHPDGYRRDRALCTGRSGGRGGDEPRSRRGGAGRGDGGSLDRLAREGDGGPRAGDGTYSSSARQHCPRHGHPRRPSRCPGDGCELLPEARGRRLPLRDLRARPDDVRPREAACRVRDGGHRGAGGGHGRGPREACPRLSDPERAGDHRVQEGPYDVCPRRGLPGRPGAARSGPLRGHRLRGARQSRARRRLAAGWPTGSRGASRGRTSPRSTPSASGRGPPTGSGSAGEPRSSTATTTASPPCPWRSRRRDHVYPRRR